MFGALGNTWRYNFYMGMQNEINIEKWEFPIFDSHLYIEDMPPRMSPICLYGEAIHLKCFTPKGYVKNKEYPSWMHILRWQPLHNWFKTAILCMLALYGPTTQVATLKPYFQAR